jgi:hypothetical protein
MPPITEKTLIQLGIVSAIVFVCYVIGDKLMSEHGNLIGLAIGVGLSYYYYTHQDEFSPPTSHYF